MDNPKVTIMIPTYNQALVVSKAIESAINQTYNNLEIIVADDCSTDNTNEIVKPYLSNKNIIYHCNTINLGRVGNYKNTLYNLAKGDFVLNLDGDDYLTDNEYIENAIDLIKQDNEIVLVFARVLLNFVSQNKKTFSYKFKNINKINDGKEFFIQYLHPEALNHTTAVYNRNVAIKAEFYQTNIIAADWESLAKIFLDGKIGYINKVVAVWNLHDTNASFDVQNNTNLFINNLQMIYNPYRYAIKKKYYKPNRLKWWKFKNLYALCFLTIGRFYLKKNVRQIRSYLKRLLFHEPLVAICLIFDIRLYLMFIIGNTFFENSLRKLFYKLKGMEI